MLLIRILSLHGFRMLGLFLLLPLQAMSQEPLDTLYEERMPMFTSEACAAYTDYESKKPCADRAMLEFIYGQLTYPKKARRWEVQGLAVVRFIVEKDGRMSSPEIVQDPGKGTGEEALRVVQLMMQQPPWSPGIQDGKPVRVEFNLPIQFMLN